MAYDLLTKKQTSKDWSCGDEATAPVASGSASISEKLAPWATVAAIGAGLWVLTHQPPARSLQEQHLRAWKRHAA